MKVQDDFVVCSGVLSDFDREVENEDSLSV